MESKIRNEAKRVFGKGKVSAAFELGGEDVLSQNRVTRLPFDAVRRARCFRIQIQFSGYLMN